MNLLKNCYINLEDTTKKINDKKFLNICINNILKEVNNTRQNIIGVYMNKSCETILIIYAILLSGNIYLPLDKSYPTEKINFYLYNSKCKIIITDTINSEFDESIKKIYINDFCEKYIDINYNNLYNDILNDNAYILYTSGTTGNPKGAINKLDSLINHVNFLYEEYNFETTDNLLMKTPLSFDASTWELFLPLFKNIKLFIINNDEYKNIRKMVEIIIKNKINIIQIVPSLGIPLLENIKLIDSEFKFKYIFCGGEPLTFKLAQQLKTISKYVVNLYGPTECCCNSIVYKYNENDFNNKKGLYCPIGVPISNTFFKIINLNGDEINNDEEGELLIGGTCVGLGYINNEEETKKKFININNKIFYKTGDIVKYIDNKYLLFVKRIDKEIKINGQRINLEEIEELIYLHPLVKNCIILIVNNILTCNIVPKNIDIDIIKNLLKDKLEIFKIPKIFVTYDNFPELPNGKTDIISIKKHIFSNYNKPIDKILSKEEEIIYSILNKLLNNDTIYDNEINITYYGIDSLGHMILISELERIFEMEIDISKVNSINSILNIIKEKNVNKISKKFNNQEFIDNLRKLFNSSNKLIVIHSSLKDFNLDILSLREQFIKLIDEYILNDYTFLFPSFNYSFCKNKYYHYKYSKNETGILSDWILNMKNSIRTNNPIFSWVVIGKDSDFIKNLPNNNCFGENSIFDYLYKVDCTYLLLGCEHYTQIHYCEENVKVRWRENKYFEGIVNFENKNENFGINYYCRKLDQKNNLGFQYMNIINKLAEKYLLCGSFIYKFSNKIVCDEIIDKLKSGKLIPN